MWLNKEKISNASISAYRKTLIQNAPNYIVIDDLFNGDKLDEVLKVLQLSSGWLTQKHSYSALYVDDMTWLRTRNKQRFVKRDLWQRDAADTDSSPSNLALAFLSFLRSDEFLVLLSRIFRVSLTDINLDKPDLNTNYFRLGASDFVNQHADDSPGRQVCMLLYLNKDWQSNNGGELVFMGTEEKHIYIEPQYNRCVLFDPSSPGAEHWVNALKAPDSQLYRYNVTSWYWSK
ncbi:2OG-Fe(II) oxygenase [Arsukibacterium sp.]|uniref:2OG-Fe(II) oxygenase n=1 Tax=Arsukibacterium sp. TaxID=1977258 RepID=UPI002FDB1DD7